MIQRWHGASKTSTRSSPSQRVTTGLRTAGTSARSPGARADKVYEEVTGLGLDDGEERSWTVKVAVALAVLAAVGVLLTAILSVPGGGEQ